jgi:hypothetical protein
VDEPESAAALDGDAGGAQEVGAGEVHGTVHDPLTVLRQDEVDDQGGGTAGAGTRPPQDETAVLLAVRAAQMLREAQGDIGGHGGRESGERPAR